MPTYEEKEQELVFSAEESSENVCPVCGSELDYAVSEAHDVLMVYPWRCEKCGTSGKEFGAIRFDGHNVDFTTMPSDTQAQYVGARARCVNGMLKVGDLVLAASGDGSFPCLPGRVAAIDMLGSKDHATGNETDDVHVDFAWDYGDRRKREIVEEDAGQRGYEIPFEEIRLDDVVMSAGDLIIISEIGDRELGEIMESEENALRYAYKAVLALR